MRTVSLENTKASDMDCPRCKVPMFMQTCSGYPVSACGECLGMWIGHDVLELIYQDAPRQLQPVPGPTTTAVNLSDPAGTTTKNQAAYVPCPTCHNMMNPRNYAGRSGVIIDFCKLHGVWFDAGELNRILDFHAKGGQPGPDLLAQEKARARAELHKLRKEAAADVQAGAMHGLRGGSHEVRSSALFARAIGSLWLDR